VGVAAASAVAYFRIERERRLERAMGKVVSSESNSDDADGGAGGGGWSPEPDNLAKRKFVATKWGWFPVDDGHHCELICSLFLLFLSVVLFLFVLFVDAYLLLPLSLFCRCVFYEACCCCCCCCCCFFCAVLFVDSFFKELICFL
jgi:hypothetical protein